MHLFQTAHTSNTIVPLQAFGQDSDIFSGSNPSVYYTKEAFTSNILIFWVHFHGLIKSCYVDHRYVPIGFHFQYTIYLFLKLRLPYCLVLDDGSTTNLLIFKWWSTFLKKCYCPTLIWFCDAKLNTDPFIKLLLFAMAIQYKVFCN